MRMSIGFGWLLFTNALLAQEPVVKVPAGFVVTEFAGDDLAHDIYSMTIDSHGRVVVAGAGYVKILVDNDGDGRADEAKQFSEYPKNGAQGMYFHGSSLICIGDGGLLRFKDLDGNDQADGPPEVFLKLKTGGEHDAHSVQQGPDGWWYVIAGNMAEIGSKYATLPTSPVKTPRAGVLFRLKPDLSGAELLADGLRNAYDFAFNPQGDLFTYDSDEEREISLPWYRPTRVYHTMLGSDHGWVSKSWMRRDGFFDMPPAIASFGRGSPTGVACYRHTQFPKRYQGALFVLDWTYGRVHALPLKSSSETWSIDPAPRDATEFTFSRPSSATEMPDSTEPELFMTGTGQNGFAPTDVEIGPDGSLYVCVGGRGTRGAVYRVQYVGTDETAANSPAHKTTSPENPADDQERLVRILGAPQPLSSWSRAEWVPAAKDLGSKVFRAAVLDHNLPAGHRIRALEVLVELFQGIDAPMLNSVQTSEPAEVRARAIWAYSRTTLESYDVEIVAKYLSDSSPLVGRCTLEACLILTNKNQDWSKLIPGLAQRLGGHDRFNRTLAAGVVARLDEKLLPAISKEATKTGARAVVSYAMGWFARSSDNARRVRSVLPPLAIAVLKKKSNLRSLKLDAVRLLQMTLGDMGPGPARNPVFDGYASSIDLEEFEQELDSLRVELSQIFPTGDAPLDHELVRLFSMITTFSGPVIDAFCARLTDDSDPIEDLHYLVAIARCPMTHSVQQRDTIVKSLVLLEEKLEARHLPQDASWPDRIKEIWLKLALADQFLAPTIVSHPKFGLPGHTVFLNQMPPEILTAARDAFVRKISATPDYAWNNDVVFALGDSEAAAQRALVREQYGRFSVRGSVLIVLSRQPESADREKFVEGLEWSQMEVQTACLSALQKLGSVENAVEQVALVKALRRLGADETEYLAREQVVKLLERNSRQRFPFETGKAGHRPQPETVAKWTDWVQTRFPEESAKQLGNDSQELIILRKMLTEIDWNRGDVANGNQLFIRRACLQCHNGRSALGPDLSGVAGRFSREDLFVAIVAPSKDVSSRYQTTVVSTKEGKSYSGLIVYESVDGFLLRNSSGQTVRIESSQVEEKRKSPVSLMPAGLLRDLTPQDYADLYAYLKSIGSVQATAGSHR